jgi:hypothetical protein
MTRLQNEQTVATTRDASLPPRLWLDWIAAFAAGLTLYVLTCAPDVLPGDCGIYQVRAPLFPRIPPDLMPDALVHMHLLYLALAKAFTWLPVGPLAYRVNLASACFGAIALASVFTIIRVMTRSRWAAALGALSLGLGHTFWAYSVIADCRPLVSAFLAAELLGITLFVRTRNVRWLLLAWFLNGVGLNNHMLALLPTPIYLAFAISWWRRGRLRGIHLAACLGLWLLGAGVYLGMVAQAAARSGDLVAALRSATTGGWPAANLEITTSLLLKVASWLLMQYPTLLIILGLVAIRLRPPVPGDAQAKWVIAGVAAVHFLFAARYPIPDQYKFFMPFYACMGILIGLGAWEALRRWRSTRWALLALAVAPAGIYIVLPSVARRVEPRLFTGALAYPEPFLSYADPYDFFFRPWQCGNYSLRRYGADALRTVPRDSLLFADYTLGTGLFYLHAVERDRPDTRMAFGFANLPLDSLLSPASPSALKWIRPVYSLGLHWPYVPEALQQRCRFIREGPVYRVDPPATRPAS